MSVSRHNYQPVEAKFWGDFACFTRPEMKVERVSYPMMTPSAARGALEAIYWKPQMAWRITEIAVLNPINYISITRNEIRHRQTAAVARKWAKDGTGGFAADDTDKNRTQRHTLALRDVAYIVRAQIDVLDGPPTDEAKHRDQFHRRINRGRCFATPYLGCREFAAAFGPPDPGDTPTDLTEHFGTMLLDLDYGSHRTGHGTPMFFDAHMENGVLRVPDRTEAVNTR